MARCTPNSTPETSPARQPGSAASNSRPHRAIRGEGAIADTSRAVQAARTYLAAGDVAGTARVTGGDTIEVTTSAVYTTKFLSIIGINHLTVTGHAQATITRALQGVQR